MKQGEFTMGVRLMDTIAPLATGLRQLGTPMTNANIIPILLFGGIFVLALVYYVSV